MTKNQLETIHQKVTVEDKKTIELYENKFTKLIGIGYGKSFAAGRMAFHSILTMLSVGPEDEVILTGFTCSVMGNAVWRTGAKPVFTDIDPDTMGSSAAEIKKKITTRTKIVVAQHSFGIPCNIADIAQLCKENDIFLIEDCAISVDSSFMNKKVGTWGDAAIFSTDHTKPLNTLIGGFLFTKNEHVYKQICKNIEEIPTLDDSHIQNLYNQFCYEQKYNTPALYKKIIIKNYYHIIKSKIISRNKAPTFLNDDYVKANINKPNYPYPASIPSFLAQIGIYEIERWENEKTKRRGLLKQYLNIMKDNGHIQYIPKAYFDQRYEIIPLRFVFQHPESTKIIKKMENIVDIESFWFKRPVICCESPESMGYDTGSCKIAESVGENIINWPCLIPEGWETKLIEDFEAIMTSDLSDN